MIKNKHNGLLIITDSYPALSETFIRSHIINSYSFFEEIHVAARNIYNNDKVLQGIGSDILKVKSLRINKFYHLNKLEAFWYLLKNPFLLFQILINPSKNKIRRKLLKHRFIEFLKSNNISHIHFHFGTTAKEFFKIFGKIQGIHFYATFHGYDIRLLEKKPRYYDTIIRKLDKAIAISNWNYLKIKSMGFEDANIVAINNSIDTSFFRKKIKQRDKKNKKIKIVSVGRLVTIKGFNLSIIAFSKLLNEFQSDYCFSYDIVGDGPEWSSLQNIIGTLNLQDKVRLLGPKNSAQIVDELESADVLLISSLAEALPTVMLEAMSMGLPIVATNVGGISSILHNQNELIENVDSYSMFRALQNMIGKIDNWSEIGKANRDIILDNFSSKVVKEKLYNLYYGIGN
jgi:colanic acid/amylovoran biosynthesis glycosyltransferase